MERRVVITGMGVVTPLGNDIDSMWNNMINGVSGAGYITCMNTDDFPVKIGAEIKGFQEDKYLDKKDARRMDLFIQYAINASFDALKDSGIDIEKYGPERVSVLYGSGMGGLRTLEENHEKMRTKGPAKISPFFIPYTIVDMTSGEISIKTGAKGPNFSVVSACATGAQSVGVSAIMIKSGMTDVAIAGGSESAITGLGLGGFISAQALCTKFNTPQDASRPFDRTRDGFLIAEGAGSLILEELESAKRRGAKIYAEVVGIGMTGDAYHITSPGPEGEGAARSMIMAMQGINPRDIGYINAHGTSTQLNDKFETMAIKTALKEYAKSVNVSSTKSMTGHMLGAAGAVELIASIMSLNNSLIPPTINYQEPDPECDLNYTPNKAVEREYKVALSNSLGFGGHNVTIAVSKFQD